MLKIIELCNLILLGKLDMITTQLSYKQIIKNNKITVKNTIEQSNI